MSGGSLEYFYCKLEEVAEMIYDEKSKEEKVVSNLCKDLAILLHDLEWYTSGNYVYEDFKNAFDMFESKWLKEEK